MFPKSLAMCALVASILVPAAASAAPGYVANSTKMRAGPDMGFPAVAMLRRGADVEIHGCLANRSWCDVEFRGDRGWLPANALLGESTRGREPVTTMNIDLGTQRFNLDEYWDTNY